MRLTQLVRPNPVWACSLAVVLATGACDTLYGLDGYSTHPGSVDGGHAGSPLDASTGSELDGASNGEFDDAPDDGASDSAASCDVDLTVQCYACAPTETPQFLNACTNAACVPFDDVSRLANLLGDGGLPPLPPPPVDGGSD
jgi:hypothetical protein